MIRTSLTGVPLQPMLYVIDSQLRNRVVNQEQNSIYVNYLMAGGVSSIFVKGFFVFWVSSGGSEFIKSM